MSTPSAGRGRRRAWLVATLLGACGLFLTLGAGSAFAASCNTSAADSSVLVVSVNNETATLSVGPLSHINLNGVWCNGGPTTSTTDLINVVGSGVNDTLVIDESGGFFQPGNFPESGGTNEIEFLLGTPGNATTAAASNGVEHLVVNGNASPDTIYVGDGLLYTVPTSATSNQHGADAVQGAGPAFALTEGNVGGLSDNEVPINSLGFMNLNGDEDADVFTAGSNPGAAAAGALALPSITINGNTGADFIAGVGTHGTGAAVDDVGLVINGGPGDDTLIGGSGDDLISTGSGNDVVDGGDSSEDNGFGSGCFSGIDGAGNPDVGVFNGDTITYAASTGPVTVDLDPNEAHPGKGTKPDGVDVIQNIENIVGSPGNDTLSGDNNDNVILGGPGDDKIAGDAGNDCEFGENGNDTFDENEGTSAAQGGTGFSNGSDLMLGGAGADDTIDYSSRTTRIDVFLEPLPNFSILAGGFNNPNESSGCDLTQIGGRATHGFINGNTVGLVPDGADVNGDGDAVDLFDEFDCVFLDTENAVGGSGNDILDAAFTGNRSDNEFTGNGGNDLEVGGAGNDWFHEGTAPNGADDLDGGTGSDTCDYSQRTGNLNVSIDGSDNDGEAGEGDNCGGVVAFNFILLRRATHGFGEGQPSSPQNTENILGGSGADVLTGNDQQNVLAGNGGNDVLNGLGGPDTLQGGDGDDVLSGGSGNDASDGGNGTDTVDESSAGTPGVGVVVNLTTGQLSGDGTDTLTGLENATGTSFADKLTGDANNNVLNGRGGNDAIQGKAGDDTINGGDGKDELGGGSGNDAIDGGRDADTARGGAGDDNITGGPGPDTLIGGGGDDVLSGGANPDFLNGGPGSDRCIPGAPGFGHGDRAVNCES